MKILLIDDNPDDRLLILRELKKLFIVDVEEIIDNQGLERVLQHIDFDIVITDYQLRWTTGIEVLIKIKSINPMMPVIMFTGTGSEEIAVMAMKIGLNDYILKSPQHYVRLAMAVKSAILRMQDELLRKQAENALRKSEENYRTLVENIGIGFTRYDKDFNILMVNEAQARLFKRDSAEFTGLKSTDLYTRHSIEMHRDQENLPLPVYLPREILTQGICADETLFDAQVRTFPTFDSNGGISGYIEIAEDVSGRLRSERLQEVVYNIANAVLITFSLNQLLTVISNELARVTNTSDMQVVLFSEKAKTNYQVLFTSGSCQNQGEPIEGKTLAGLVISQGNALLLKKPEIENKLRAGEIDYIPDGLKVWMGIPLRGRSNILGALVLQSCDSENALTASDMDILQFVSNQIAIAIENKRSADSLRESEMRFRSLVEQSADGVMIINDEGTIIEWNHAMTAILMISSQEAIGKKILDLHFELSDEIQKDENFLTQMKAQFQKRANLLFEQESIVDEIRIKLRSGELRILELSIFRIKFDGGLNTGVFVKDVTDQKRAAEEIAIAVKKVEESDRYKTTFISNISHELRTPLNAIVGFAALQAEAGQSEENRKIYCEQIFENSRSLLNQFNNITELAKIESGFVDLSFTDFEVNEFMDEMAKDANKGLFNKNIAFRVVKSSPDKNVMMNSDRHYLKQTLNQLLTNAFKFTSEGYVEIGYNLRENGNIIFTVRDTGQSLPDDKVQHLPDHGFQSDDGIDLTHGGIGIRVNVVKKIVTLLGGEVQYESAKPQGSVFSIVLPLAKLRKEKEMNEFLIDNLATITGKWAGKTILIVEDVDSNYQFLVATIRRSGATIVWARQGEEAIELITKGQSFDLVLMDVQLVGMDGYEVTRRIKELRPGLPIVAQTAYAMIGEKEKSQAAGCDEYLAKPIRPAILLQTMNKYLC